MANWVAKIYLQFQFCIQNWLRCHQFNKNVEWTKQQRHAHLSFLSCKFHVFHFNTTGKNQSVNKTPKNTFAFWTFQRIFLFLATGYAFTLWFLGLICTFVLFLFFVVYFYDTNLMTLLYRYNPSIFSSVIKFCTFALTVWISILLYIISATTSYSCKIKS